LLTRLVGWVAAECGVAGSIVREVDIPAWWTAGAEPLTTAAGRTLRRCEDSPIILLANTGG
jgi:hypothetical protein